MGKLFALAVTSAIFVTACGADSGVEAGQGSGDDSLNEAPAVVPADSGALRALDDVGFETPAGWHVAAETLTPDRVDPLEVLSVATFPLSAVNGVCHPFPWQAVVDFPTDGAFVTLRERFQVSASTPRPAAFGPDAAPYVLPEGDCLDNTSRGDIGTMHWFEFEDQSRSFELLVVIGSQASEAVVVDAWQIANSITVEAVDRPDPAEEATKIPFPECNSLPQDGPPSSERQQELVALHSLLQSQFQRLSYAVTLIGPGSNLGVITVGLSHRYQPTIDWLATQADPDDLCLELPPIGYYDTPPQLAAWVFADPTVADDPEATKFTIVLDQPCGLSNKSRILDPQIRYSVDEISIGVPIRVQTWGVAEDQSCHPPDEIVIVLTEARNGRPIVAEL